MKGVEKNKNYIYIHIKHWYLSHLIQKPILTPQFSVYLHKLDQAADQKNKNNNYLQPKCPVISF